MNEQILKLVEQARQYAWENEKHWSAGPEREELFEAKFAELIVLECANLFADDLASMQDYTGKACRYMVKEHFGLVKTIGIE